MKRRYGRGNSRRRERPWLPLGLVLLLFALLLPFLLPQEEEEKPPPPRAELLLPDGLDGLRRALVLNAAALEGRVGYFWGGKSLALGWDARWGVPTVVTAEGSDTSGYSDPFGLDCSGLVTWAAVNAAGTADAVDVIGNGVRDQYGKCEAAAWSEAQPGDLAFFPDLSHVGIVLGWGPSGGLRVLHCSKTLGGVVVSEDGGGIGFSLVGRPAFYAFYAGEEEE